MALSSTASVWELDDDIYRQIVEDEIGAWMNDEEWIADELAMCFSVEATADPDKGFLYWARRHWHLVNKAGVVVLFRPNPLQWRYLLTRGDENVELKARKLGQSTIIDLLYYWRARQRSHQHMYIVAHTQDASVELWARLQFGHSMLKERRPFLWAPTTRTNRRELIYADNFSKLRIMTAGGKGIGRAADADGIHLSEAAHYDDLAMTLAAIGEAKRPGAWIDIESTPNGYETFRSEYVRAREAESHRVAHFYAWFSDPRNSLPGAGVDLELSDEEAVFVRTNRVNKDQIAWRREKLKDLGPLFKQEHPEDDETCFLLGGTPLFDNQVLREIYKRIEREDRTVPLEILRDSPLEGDDNGRFFCWKPPEDEHDYVFGADIAEGIPGLAYSVICVLDITNGAAEQVAEWRGHINPFNFGNQLLAPLGLWYNKALIAPERNNHGHASIAGLKDVSYPRIYKHRSNMKTRWGQAQAPKYGFPNSGETRPQILSLLRKSLGNGEFHPRSLRLIRECMAMQAEEAHADADKPATEFRDCIFAAAIALYIRRKSIPIIL